jgi:uncharacterized membrane protein YphA (DoxX/SURF4 family)
MAVAYFYAHAPRGFYPILNQGELALLYCFLFLYPAGRGWRALERRRWLAPRGRLSRSLDRAAHQCSQL